MERNIEIILLTLDIDGAISKSSCCIVMRLDIDGKIGECLSDAVETDAVYICMAFK